MYSCGHREDSYEHVDCADFEKNNTCDTRETVDYWAGSKRTKDTCSDCASKKQEEAKKDEETTGDNRFEPYFLRLIKQPEISQEDSHQRHVILERMRREAKTVREFHFSPRISGARAKAMSGCR